MDIACRLEMSSAPTSVTLQSGERISNIVRYHSVRAAVGVGWNKVRNKFERDQGGSVQQFNITNSRTEFSRPVILALNLQGFLPPSQAPFIPLTQ